MMNRGVFGRQMFKYGGHVKMQDGGSVPQGPMPTDQGPMVDPEMAALAEGAMEQGVDPQMVQDELAGYASQFEQMDQAEDYESAINAIRGDDLPIEDRYAELAELVGPEDAQSTPESVLTLVQPVIQMAEVDQGIGGLAAGQMEDVAVEGPMSQGIMSTVNLGADEEAAPPANFNQGGVVPPVQYYGNGGGPGANPTDSNQKITDYYNMNLSGSSNAAPDNFRGYMGLEIHPSEFRQDNNTDITVSPQLKAIYDTADALKNPPQLYPIESNEGNPVLKSVFGKLPYRETLQPQPNSVYPVEEEKKVEEKAKEVDEKAKKIEAKEADLEADQKKHLERVGDIIKKAADESGDEELKKYMKRYKDILMDDESIKKNLKENKDMAKAQMLFGLAEGFFKFGSTPRKGGQSSLQVLMQSMAPAIQNASQQVAVLQAQKQKIEDRQMQIKLAALKSFDQKELAMAKAKAQGRLSLSDQITAHNFFEDRRKQLEHQSNIDKLLNEDVSAGYSAYESEYAKKFKMTNNALRDSHGAVLDKVGRGIEKFVWTFLPDDESTKLIKEKYRDEANASEEKQTLFSKQIDESYAAADKFRKSVKSSLNGTFRYMYRRNQTTGASQDGFNQFKGTRIDIDTGTAEENLARINTLIGDLKEEEKRTKAIINDRRGSKSSKAEDTVFKEMNHLRDVRSNIGDLEVLRSALLPAEEISDKNKDTGMEAAHGGKKATGGIRDAVNRVGDSTRSLFKEADDRYMSQFKALAKQSPKYKRTTQENIDLINSKYPEPYPEP